MKVLYDIIEFLYREKILDQKDIDILVQKGYYKITQTDQSGLEIESDGLYFGIDLYNEEYTFDDDNLGIEALLKKDRRRKTGKRGRFLGAKKEAVSMKNSWQ
jgi:hypothetical protein